MASGQGFWMSRRVSCGRVATGLVVVWSLVTIAGLEAQQPPAGVGGRGPTTRGSVQSGDGETTPGGFGGGRFGGRGGFGGRATPAVGEGPACTFDATIYDVRVPVDQVGRMDVEALAKASESVDAFEKALELLGNVKPLYRTHQSVRLGGDSLNIGSQVPIVTNARLTAAGQAVSSVQYQNVGAHFTIAGRSGAAGGGDLDLSIDVSASSDTGANNPILRTATLSHKGPFQPNRPMVVVSVDAGSVDRDGKAVAYIARVIVGEAQMGGAK